MEKVDKLSKIKEMLTAFIEKNGSLDYLKKTDPEYSYIVGSKLCDKNGKKLSMEEVFSLAGFPRQKKTLSKTEKINSLKQAIDKFVKEGGDVQYLTKKDILYRKIKDTEIIKDGKTLSLEEKFTFLGYRRPPVKNNYVETMKKILDISRFQDENGFVDSYRSYGPANNFIDTTAKKFNMSPTSIILLVGNYNLKKCYLNIDREKYLVAELKNYLNTHHTLEHLKQKDQKLYNLFRTIKKSYCTYNGIELSANDFIDVLGLGDYDNNFREPTSKKLFDIEKFLKKYANAIERSNGQLFVSDIDSIDYHDFVMYARRIGSTVQEILNSKGITYAGRSQPNKSNVTVKQYPFLEEMRKTRDLKFQEYCQNNPDANKNEQQLLKSYIDICSDVYNEFYPKIIEKCIPSPEDEIQKEQL